MELDLILSIVGIVLTTIGSVASLAYWLGRKFSQVNERLERVEEKLERSVDALKNAVLSINSLILEFMSLKGLIEDKEVHFLASEVSRILGFVKVNPLKREEIEFLRKVLYEKIVVRKQLNQVTLEEAEKVVEIGKRWWLEDGGEEAYKLFLAGLVLKGYIISRRVKKGKSGF